MPIVYLQTNNNVSAFFRLKSPLRSIATHVNIDSLQQFMFQLLIANFRGAKLFFLTRLNVPFQIFRAAKIFFLTAEFFLTSVRASFNGFDTIYNYIQIHLFTSYEYNAKSQNHELQLSWFDSWIAEDRYRRSVSVCTGIAGREFGSGSILHLFKLSLQPLK